MTYHVGSSNKHAIGICLTGDFRSQSPTKAQEESLRSLVQALIKDLPQYTGVRGHNEFPGYSWKNVLVLTIAQF
ncbi:N-acetylmuramoyl-L-alanine amidase [Bacillaceae bacterium SIJ1]|nr:N-acetylmuramoyl-L-alanine amidase [Litoribacterium kuwaitense]